VVSALEVIAGTAAPAAEPAALRLAARYLLPADSVHQHAESVTPAFVGAKSSRRRDG
jgi:hypothetical protein